MNNNTSLKGNAMPCYLGHTKFFFALKMSLDNVAILDCFTLSERFIEPKFLPIDSVHEFKHFEVDITTCS